MSAKIVIVNAGNFDAEVLQAKGLVLVDFWAEWCHPCKMLAPVIEKIAVDYANRVKVCKLGIDEDQELAARFGVMSIPTVIFFKDGKEVGRTIGYQPFEEFIIDLDKNI